MVSPATVRRGVRGTTRSIRYTLAKGRVSAAPAPTPPPSTESVIFQQSDVVLDYGLGSGCSGLPVGAQVLNVQLSEFGVPGTKTRTFSLSSLVVRAHVFMLSVSQSPGVATWDEGTWVVRLRITGEGAPGAQIRTCHVCRVDKFGVNLATAAFATNLFISCSTGIKTISLSGVESIGEPTDRVLIVLGMRSTLGVVTVPVIPDQKVDSPIQKLAA